MIVGSGPAGVSAAFPLVKAGLSVLMVDGGNEPSSSPPELDFLSWRAGDHNQSSRIIGKNFYSLKPGIEGSPKLRIPGFEYVFKDFKKFNQIENDGYITIGSLSTGGLSNAWGSGVACLSETELLNFPFPSAELAGSYEDVAKRIGISGRSNDDLANYHGVDKWAQDPIVLDAIHSYLFARYQKNTSDNIRTQFSLGRTRLATLSADMNDRKACTLSGNCLWGCINKSIYSAADEILGLKMYKNFRFLPGFRVQNISSLAESAAIEGIHFSRGIKERFEAKKIFLAAGAIASSALALKALHLFNEVPVLSCPTAAFMIWVPRFLGLPRESGFGSGQLAFKLKLEGENSAYGATFATLGIPVSEFLGRVPMKAPFGLALLSNLLSSCIVGNLFLPGHLGGGKIQLTKQGGIMTRYEPHSEALDLAFQAKRILARSYRKMGAVLLPGSYTIGNPGGDIHYAGTLPMRLNPARGETTRNGELSGLPGIHVVDGASLPLLTEKPHTLTIMANADRIARNVVLDIKSNN
ncbi:MAG: 4Fe-4S ferredoxin [Patescibacteria group bacterium]|nr:4Fe-4S ferredoxin [Patescibacteria group bacterium]